jgi:hypothetical protein
MLVEQVLYIKKGNPNSIFQMQLIGVQKVDGTEL